MYVCVKTKGKKDNMFKIINVLISECLLYVTTWLFEATYTIQHVVVYPCQIIERSGICLDKETINADTVSFLILTPCYTSRIIKYTSTSLAAVCDCPYKTYSINTQTNDRARTERDISYMFYIQSTTVDTLSIRCQLWIVHVR